MPNVVTLLMAQQVFTALTGKQATAINVSTPAEFRGKTAPVLNGKKRTFSKHWKRSTDNGQACSNEIVA